MRKKPKMQTPETFHCRKCRKVIGGHNQYLHGGMCDDCFFETYFPDSDIKRQKPKE